MSASAPLGIVDDLRERRARIRRANPHLQRTWRKPPAKVHHITVNLATGERIVEQDVQPKKVEQPVAASVMVPIKRTPTQNSALVAVCDAFEIQACYIDSESRPNWIARPRFAYYRLLREVVGLSMMRIGKLADRDHTSVLHGIRRCRDLCESDPEYARLYHLALEKLVGAK